VPADTITARDWETIVSRLYAGQCVPFLGAGVNAGGGNEKGLPLGRQVALELANDLITTDVAEFEKLVKVEVLDERLKDYPQLLRLQLHNLACVAFHLARAVDSPHVMGMVQQLLSDEDEVPSKLLTTLARLRNVRLIVTTNYDLLMEKALDDAGREYVKVVQPVEGFREDELATKDSELAAAKAAGTLILYKIHGSFPEPAEPAGAGRRIILTEEDYIEFLTVVANDKIGIPPAIKAEMTTATLLFLGYSLEDWDFRTLFKGTIETLERFRTYKSFAIQLEPSPFWAKFWAEEKKVVVYDMDLRAFASALEDRYRAYEENVAQNGDE
jgi:SIR2-like domain